ncbi:MAG: hypothetical protein Q7J31_15075 [Syntrophales bacterium]|nr:hypothetical protein [Syntrophales bacterium]
MSQGLEDNFPGGSKSRVNRAGNNVRKGSATAGDWHVIDDWRASHRAVLNTFQAILRTRMVQRLSLRSAIKEDQRLQGS